MGLRPSKHCHSVLGHQHCHKKHVTCRLVRARRRPQRSRVSIPLTPRVHTIGMSGLRVARVEFHRVLAHLGGVKRTGALARRASPCFGSFPAILHHEPTRTHRHSSFRRDTPTDARLRSPRRCREDNTARRRRRTRAAERRRGQPDAPLSRSRNATRPRHGCPSRAPLTAHGSLGRRSAAHC